MQREKTRIWRGGMAEILKANAQLPGPSAQQVVDLRLECFPDAVGGQRMVSLALQAAPSSTETRVMNAEELKALRQAQRALAPRRDLAPRAPRESTDPALQRIVAELHSPARARKRAWLVLVLALLSAGGWVARRAPAMGHAQATRAASPQRQTGSAPRPPSAQAASALEASVARPAMAARDAERVLPRAGVDALAAGDDLAAARLYRTLASQAADGALYQAAAEILTARAHGRERSAPSPVR